VRLATVNGQLVIQHPSAAFNDLGKSRPQVNEFSLCSLRIYGVVGSGTYVLPMFIHREFIRRSDR
jgi:hypothetical protein